MADWLSSDSATLRQSCKKGTRCFRSIVVCAAIVMTGCGGGSSEPTSPPASGQTPVVDTPPAPSTPPVAPAEYSTPYPHIDLLHTVLTFDAARSQVYAYVPKSDALHPGSIATVDGISMGITYSSALDFIPYKMTVSPDAKYLYVSTADTNEVVRATLPDLQIDLRVRLGPQPDSRFGLYSSGVISVSTIDSQTFAVPIGSLHGWACNEGLRVYHNGEVVAGAYVDSWFGDVAFIDAAEGQVLTLCSQSSLGYVTKYSYEGSTLTKVSELMTGAGFSASLSRLGNTVLVGGGGVINADTFTVRGLLAALTYYSQGEPAYAQPLEACVFADELGNSAACLSQTDLGGQNPTTRAFVLYNLHNGAAFLRVPLDQPMTRSSSILRIGQGQFAVSAGYNRHDTDIYLDFTLPVESTRIYFLTGIDTQAH
jgi:hypothetical protein